VTRYVDIVFDGPPDANPPKFVEVEDDQGRSICFAEWIEQCENASSVAL